MNRHRRISLPLFILCTLLASLVSSGCARAVPADCPIHPPADISQMAPYNESDQGPFLFPLHELAASQRRPWAEFQVSGLETPTRREYHAAEDYLSPAGAPVYAIAGGRVSYSGPRDGYGWLIIVDHPQANLYSLYGHLSPSRWQIDQGSPVQQGDLLGYLGDPAENGGSAEQPLRPHLHLGLRAGQRSDYPTGGEWRWMAGWITPCPSDIGWLGPSAVMVAQTIPAGGFDQPQGAFMQRWAAESVLVAVYVSGSFLVFFHGLRRDRLFIFFTYGTLTLVAAIYLSNRGFASAPFLFAISAASILTGLSRLIARARSTGPADEGGQ